MTPKQRYDERRRLRAERLHKEELQAQGYINRDEVMEERLLRLMISFERVADVLELWADLQGGAE